MTTPHQAQNQTTYVLGFMFGPAKELGRSAVCLIRKQKPEWQRGLLNGVGGKCEEGEYPREAMIREFREETGVITEQGDWVKFFTMRFGNGAIVHCYTCWSPGGQLPRTMETEEVDMYSVDGTGRLLMTTQIIPNLIWLLPLAMHELVRPDHERMLLS